MTLNGILFNCLVLNKVELTYGHHGYTTNMALHKTLNIALNKSYDYTTTIYLIL